MAGWQTRLARLLLRDALPPTPQINLIGFGSSGGVSPWGITESNALGLSAIWRSVTIIAGAIASLPWGEWRGTLELPPSRLVARPSELYTRREWAWRVAATMALHNVAYGIKIGADSEGVPLSVLPVPPHSIIPQPRRDDLWGILPPERYAIGNREYEAEELVVMRRAVLPAVTDDLSGLLSLARTSFAAALSAENYASRYWQTGGSPVTQISTEQELEGTQADEIAGRWRDRRAQGPDYPAVFGKGAKAEPFGADPTQAAAVEARREQVADVGRYFGIPTSWLNAPAGDPMTYRTTEAEGLAFLRLTLVDYIGAMEDGITDLLPGGRTMRMDPTRLTRGEQLTRYQAWESALRAGWIAPEEVREIEGLPPRELPAIQSEPRPSEIVGIE
jgi:HK97 family phage portal protein